MARARFVKKARKDNPVVKKGESYYWWAFMTGGRVGPKHYSAIKPKPSQLTSSVYLSSVLATEEDLPESISCKDDWEALQSELTSVLEELTSECQDSLNNMPEGLQQGDIGQLLQERIDACENATYELENIEFDEDDEDFEFDMAEVESLLNEVVI